MHLTFDPATPDTPNRPRVASESQGFPVTSQKISTWTKTVVTMSGASAQLLPPNDARKAVMVCSTKGNTDAAYDISGGTAALDAGIPISGGDVHLLTGGEVPKGAITQYGASGQKLTVYEGT